MLLKLFKQLLEGKKVDNIFKKILKKEIPAKIVYEDDVLIVIHDIAPRAPVHLLIIPRESFYFVTGPYKGRLLQVNAACNYDSSKKWQKILVSKSQGTVL